MDAMTASLRGCLASVLKFSNLVEQQRSGIVIAQLGCLGRDPRGSCRNRGHLRTTFQQLP